MHSIQQCESRSVDSLSAYLLNKPVEFSGLCSEIKYTNFSLPVYEPERKVQYIKCCSLLLFVLFLKEEKENKKLLAKFIGSLESCFLSSCTTHNLFWFILNHVSRIMLKVHVSLYFLKLLIFPLSCQIFYPMPGYYKML